MDLEDDTLRSFTGPPAAEPRLVGYATITESSLNDDPPCNICGVTDRPDDTLLCDHCGCAFHLSCIGLQTAPRGFWYCLKCESII